MQFSYSWLRTQANPDLSADKLEHLLTMAGLEVEEIDTAAPAFSGVVVAEVKSVEKHPDADRLNVTQVDAGTGELVQIVVVRLMSSRVLKCRVRCRVPFCRAISKLSRLKCAACHQTVCCVRPMNWVCLMMV